MFGAVIIFPPANFDYTEASMDLGTEIKGEIRMIAKKLPMNHESN